MRATLTILMLLLLPLAAACREEESVPASANAPAAANLTPEELGALGAQIAREPGRANELLSSRGLNEESFEEAIRQVTQDPEASQRYRDAYQKAST